MSQHEKALLKLQKIPPPSDLKWDELKRILEQLGYHMVAGGGSRRKFYHTEKDALINCHEPHPSPNVDKGCIRDIVEHLKVYKLI